jgi:hypothetical protein
MQQTGSTNQNQSSTTTLPGWLQDAAHGNLSFLQNLQNTGFQGYGGNQVADFSGQQKNSFGLGNNLANSVFGGQIGNLAGNAAGAGASSVNANTIASQMSPYMNQYVQQALTPTLASLQQQFNTQNRSFDSSATSAGAFGDTSAALGRSNLALNQGNVWSGTVGQAYNNAFNTAIGAGAQDVANSLSAQTTNANLNETALQRQLQGANELYGLGAGVTNLQNTLGGQQTAQQQAQLNAAYNQWLMGQQYNFMTGSAMDQALNAGKNASGSTTYGTGTGNQYGANNAGYGLLGSLLGAGGTALGGYFGGQQIGNKLAGLFGGGGGGGGEAAAKGGKAEAAQPIIVGEKGPEIFVPNMDMGGAYAKGGKPPIGRPSIVGEQGPELFVPHAKGTVIPHDEVQKLAAKYANKSPKKAKFAVGGPVIPGVSGLRLPMPPSQMPAAPTMPSMPTAAPSMPTLSPPALPSPAGMSLPMPMAPGRAPPTQLGIPPGPPPQATREMPWTGNVPTPPAALNTSSYGLAV